MDTRVAVLKLFPGINKNVVEAILNIQNLRGVILETYGSGNAPTDSWFLESIKAAIERDIIVFNVSQCFGGTVMQGRYETSRSLQSIGVLSGGDITTEAAMTKMMFLLANLNTLQDVKRQLTKSIRGELS